jgi:hypothetical protein
MPELGFGLVFGVLAMVIGLILVLTFTHTDGATLGGAGLIVVGSLCVAINFDDRTEP